MGAVVTGMRWWHGGGTSLICRAGRGSSRIWCESILLLVKPTSHVCCNASMMPDACVLQHAATNACSAYFDAHVISCTHALSHGASVLKGVCTHGAFCPSSPCRTPLPQPETRPQRCRLPQRWQQPAPAFGMKKDNVFNNRALGRLLQTLWGWLCCTLG